MQPFLKVEADALLSAGYKDIGWREVSSAAFGVPNPKHHVILMATAKETGIVDSCLFSTVGLCFFAAVFCRSSLFHNTVCFCCSDVET
jgi:site-specific DNA-cytosine methylase